MYEGLWRTLFPQSLAFTPCPFIESIWHIYRKRLVFRLFSTPKCLLIQSDNGILLRSHNGVHCCGTVGDSHSHSQLIAAKRTFTDSSLLNCECKDTTFCWKYKHFFCIFSYFSNFVCFTYSPITSISEASSNNRAIELANYSVWLNPSKTKCMVLLSKTTHFTEQNHTFYWAKPHILLGKTIHFTLFYSAYITSWVSIKAKSSSRENNPRK